MKKSKLTSRVSIRFKSGQILELKSTEELSIKMTGAEVTNFKWGRTEPRLMFISLTEIESITCVPLKWYERIL